MKKRLFALILALCTVLFIFAACDGQKEDEMLSTADVVRIVLEDLDKSIEEVQPHVHTGTYEGVECYYVYVTVDGNSLAYAVHSYTGEILDISESSHSH